MIIASLLIIGLLIPTISNIMVQVLILLLSLVVMAIGYMIYSKANMYARKYGYKIQTYVDKAIALSFATFILLVSVSPVVFAATSQEQGCSRAWTDLRKKVIFAEYTALSTMVLAALLAFGPVLFGRTILGPIVQEFQSLAGSGLILLILLLLLIYPLDVIFKKCGNTNEYRIDMTTLRNEGPFLLRLLYKLQPDMNIISTG